MAGYVNSGAVDTDVDVDTSRVKGLTAVVTGGMVNHSYSSLISLMLTESQVPMASVKHIHELWSKLGKVQNVTFTCIH